MNKRKRYLVNKKFQWNFTFWVLVAVFIPVVVCTLFIFIYLKKSGWLPEIQPDFYMNTGFWSLFLSRAIPVTFAVAVFSILLSHRIAGSIKRMQIACDRLARGVGDTPITLRKNDYFQGLARKLNRLNGNHGNTIS